MAAVEQLVWDPEPLDDAQRTGDACVVCGKRWPRPITPVGVLGRSDTDSLFDVTEPTTVYSCAECAPAVRQ